ncbi:MAG: OmpP1/FadL family transporter [Candidatus Kapaibacterium sp.]
MKKIITLILISFFPALAFGQYVEDALRFTEGNGIMTPRAAGFNVSFHGVSDDIGAMMYNPAGLTLIGKSEFSVGFGFTRYDAEADYLNSMNKFGTNNENITHLAISTPVGDQKKNRSTIAIGYFLENDFEKNIEFSAFNENNTYISARSGSNMMYQLFLANEEGFTPVNDSLSQSSFIQEKGGLHNITGAAAFDVSPVVSVGFSITGKWGNFDYIKSYNENDVLNVYNSLEDDFSNVDLRSFQLEESLMQAVSGITGKLSFQGRIQEFMRVGVAIEFPTWYEFDEEFSQDATVYFDNDDSYDYNSSGSNSYNLSTPFVYSGGMSIHGAGLTFAAGIEYTDATQLEFSDAIPEVEQLNVQIVKELVGHVTWGFGVEYQVPMLPIQARASYNKKTSPYSDDIPNANLSDFSIGGSVFFDNIRIDGVMRWIDVSESRVNYGDTRYILNKQPFQLSLGFTYRYN